jgi:hypothetical protein
MSYSWFLDPDVAINGNIFPTQATFFASSSLASASATYIADDPGSQTLKLTKMTQGNRQVNNMAIFATDKSPLGVAVRRRAAALQFTTPDKEILTTPNKHSMSRNTLLTKRV